MGLALDKQEEYQNMVGTKIGYRLLLSLMDSVKEKNRNHNRYFWSRCDCGKEARVLAVDIAQGKRTHCGCMNEKRLIDLAGMRFGKWTVISRSENRIAPATGRSIATRGLTRTLTMWNCVCDCGTEKVNYGGNLRTGRTTQCWNCKMEQFKKLLRTGRSNGGKYQDHGITAKYNLVKRGAESRHLPWNLSLDDYREIAVLNCFYCGIPPTQRTGKYAVYVNGLDRYDNEIGYCNQNIVPCCWICNKLKGSRHGDDYLKKIFQTAAFNS